MAFEWTESIAVGVPKIDDQHKELFRRTNDLLESCKTGTAKDETMKAIEFLSDYVKQHLADEEELQKKHNYPGFEDHKIQHKIFLEKVDAIRNNLINDGATLANIMNTTKLFVSWLTQHIKNDDKQLGQFLRSVM